MKFEDLDKEMRVYEESLDQFILPDLFLAARLDGRSFTRLTKETCPFEAPFDIRFRDLMVETAKALMTCGFRIVYGYTESDEISLLFHPDDCTFGRKVRKLNTTLAGEASAAFSLALGRAATFDCRLIPLPNPKRVEDYFAWRQEDSHRNSLNAWCYWTLRKEGLSQGQATAALEGRSVPYKNELLFQRGINYNDLPSWQKRGTGVYFQDVPKAGFNPVTGTAVQTLRRELTADYELPLGEDYRRFVAGFLQE
nr:guanylyltransferase [Lachnospiraceae bacterium]